MNTTKWFLASLAGITIFTSKVWACSTNGQYQQTFSGKYEFLLINEAEKSAILTQHYLNYKCSTAITIDYSKISHPNDFKQLLGTYVEIEAFATVLQGDTVMEGELISFQRTNDIEPIAEGVILSLTPTTHQSGSQTYEDMQILLKDNLGQQQEILWTNYGSKKAKWEYAGSIAPTIESSGDLILGLGDKVRFYVSKNSQGQFVSDSEGYLLTAGTATQSAHDAIRRDIASLLKNLHSEVTTDLRQARKTYSRLVTSPLSPSEKNELSKITQSFNTNELPVAVINLSKYDYSFLAERVLKEWNVDILSMSLQEYEAFLISTQQEGLYPAPIGFEILSELAYAGSLFTLFKDLNDLGHVDQKSMIHVFTQFIRARTNRVMDHIITADTNWFRDYKSFYGYDEQVSLHYSFNLLFNSNDTMNLLAAKTLLLTAQEIDNKFTASTVGPNFMDTVFQSNEHTMQLIQRDISRVTDETHGELLLYLLTRLEESPRTFIETLARDTSFQFCGAVKSAANLLKRTSYSWNNTEVDNAADELCKVK